jgi:hypothetical protein
MADTIGTIDWRSVDDFFEVAKLSRGAAEFQFSLWSDDGDASGVIAAIFEFAQPLDDHGHNFLRANVADNSAHAQRLLVTFLD